MEIRLADAADTASILGIYAQYIDTPITFECALPAERDFAGRIRKISATYPCLVAEEGGKIIGYAYAGRHMERQAYQWNAELSVYVCMERVSKGVGGRLCRALIEILKMQGVKNIYGIVTVPNEKSERLHASLGFKCAGICRNTGYKCGKWRDVACFEKRIGQYCDNPAPILPVGSIPQSDIEAALKAIP